MKGENEDVIELEAKLERIQQDITDIKQGQNQLFNDKRKIEKDVQDLQLVQRLQEKDISGLRDLFNDIKEDIAYVRKEAETDRKERQDERQREHEKMIEDKKEQLKEYKNFGWKVVGGVTTGVAVAVITTLLALGGF